MLDFIAERYGMLPSQVLREGNSLDFVIADAAQGYKNKLQAEANARSQGLTTAPDKPNLSEKEMLDMVAKARELNK